MYSPQEANILLRNLANIADDEDFWSPFLLPPEAPTEKAV